MNISSINQFNIEVFIQDPTWRLINPNLIIKDGPYILENERVFFYDSDFETTFYFYFLIDRNLESSIAPILFPIIIFILLILVHIRTFPTFKNENFLNVIQKKQIDEENEKKIKLRSDVSKWLFTFSVANFLLNPSSLSFLTITWFFTIVIIFMTVIYFLFTPFSIKKNNAQNYLVLIDFAFLFYFIIVLLSYQKILF